jgi:beta-glucosidase
VRLIREPSNDALTGLHIGAARPVDSSAMQRAIDVAAVSDITILIVGTNDEWESEGWDRDDMSLPGEQDELIARVAAVSARTVVVVNAGSPVSMPWLDAVDSPVRKSVNRLPTSCLAKGNRDRVSPVDGCR